MEQKLTRRGGGGGGGGGGGAFCFVLFAPV
eukprot:COSAG06_NODE_57044_length_282_cov_0.513661_1_plen_29_part_01